MVVATDFYDNEAVYINAFEVDWGRLLAKERFKRLVKGANKKEKKALEKVGCQRMPRHLPPHNHQPHEHALTLACLW